jgi:hypothetical protein
LTPPTTRRDYGGSILTRLHTGKLVKGERFIRIEGKPELNPNSYLTILLILLLLLLLLAVSFEVIQAWSLRKTEFTLVRVPRNKNTDALISANFRI